jgi:hypothetical protein
MRLRQQYPEFGRAPLTWRGLWGCLSVAGRRQMTARPLDVVKRSGIVCYAGRRVGDHRSPGIDGVGHAEGPHVAVNNTPGHTAYRR